MGTKYKCILMDYDTIFKKTLHFSKILQIGKNKSFVECAQFLCQAKLF